MMRMTETVKQLVIINAIFYIGSNTIAPAAYDYLSLHYPLSEGFKWWQPITHMFMHAEFFPKVAEQDAGVKHLLSNMLGLVIFGPALEHFWGWKKFLFFYISCGLGAALLHVGVNYYEINSFLDKVSELNLSQTDIQALMKIDYGSQFDLEGKIINGPLYEILSRVGANQEQFDLIKMAALNFQGSALGASGALYGIMVAFAFMFPNAEMMMLFLPIPIKAKYFVSVIVFADLFMGLSGVSIFGGGGIAHFAHVGGALTGFLMMWYWKKNQFNNKRWD